VTGFERAMNHRLDRIDDYLQELQGQPREQGAPQ
jgi:hypothetical protein